MSSSYALDAYQSHDLNIMMRTSSGDTVEMDFSNQKSLSMKEDSFSFSSMQSFSFSVKGDGLDSQDQEEIAAFMQEAQPFIDSFLQEIQEDAPKSPISKIAQDIINVFEPSQPRDEDQKNSIKTNIVKMFDQSMQKLEIPQNTDQENPLDQVFEQAQKLLEKTLEAFDNYGQNIYA